MKKRSPVLLIILDGWGVGAQRSNNAIYLAKTPNMDRWQKEYPFTTLVAHNGQVGLPEGQMGNSEVGHLNIGAGRIVYQDFTRINKAVDSKELMSNKVLCELIDKTIKKGSALHLMGLLSDGGVHSHINHLLAMIDIAKLRGLEKIFVHCFMDGRDTPPKSGATFIAQLQNGLAKKATGKIATISGRFYAMDRDTRWDRVQKAWQTIVEGCGKRASDPLAAVSAAYEAGESDEFITPINIYDNDKPLAVVEDDDSILFYNFRADRARQLSHAFTDPNFDKFTIKSRPKLLEFVTCTRYEKGFDSPVLFPPTELQRILGEEISRQGLKQLRIAETEKYAHVTYFFNGGRETVFPNEDRILIESPRDVATYDLKPEMSAIKITDTLLKTIAEKEYDLIVVNYANGDMVGHTGVIPAAIKACETVDNCLGELIKTFQQAGGITLITADHGNADIMINEVDKAVYTAHTTNPVPFILISEAHKGQALSEGGALKDIAPTILTLLNLAIPDEMDGECLYNVKR